MDEKTLAWINLGIVACGVYGTRVMAFSVRRRSERTARIAGLPSPGSPPPPPPRRTPNEPETGGKVNGPPRINLDDLTPPWMAVPPENEILP